MVIISMIRPWAIPLKERHSLNVGLMLIQRLRGWPTSNQHLLTTSNEICISPVQSVEQIANNG